jgi:hypothetical protein
VVIILPEYVFITKDDEIGVAVWDYQDQEWRTDPISELQYDRLAKKLEFVTKKLAPMAYI